MLEETKKRKDKLSRLSSCSLHTTNPWKIHLSDTVEPPSKGHFGTTLFVLCKEVILFGRFKMYKTIGKMYSWTSSLVLCREVYCTVSLFGRIHYRRFHCIFILFLQNRETPPYWLVVT